MPHQDLPARITQIWERRTSLNAHTQGPDRTFVDEALDALDAGELRVAEPTETGWTVHAWLKQAVLLSFRLNDSHPMPGTGAPVFDKVPLKSTTWDEARFQSAGFRMVPGAIVGAPPTSAPTPYSCPASSTSAHAWAKPP